ncbi:hypothetical protein BD289DRAFT_217199 [Coniella lustricola]|uniref:Uncharacterized protein n=1 Tax=Coniella lustricola TaxID=2025994 RepID=A0A2T3ABD6_9PEZI|nr:hypothetical protein BD289DRAFT_217199 [Coniella lustricola]
MSGQQQTTQVHGQAPMLPYSNLYPQDPAQLNFLPGQMQQQNPLQTAEAKPWSYNSKTQQQALQTGFATRGYQCQDFSATVPKAHGQSADGSMGPPPIIPRPIVQVKPPRPLKLSSLVQGGPPPKANPNAFAPSRKGMTTSLPGPSCGPESGTAYAVANPEEQGSQNRART